MTNATAATFISDATCPECGARRLDGMTCWEQMGAVCAWEWQDPELAAVHFLTVATYNLQHPAMFTDVAISGLREAFIAHLDAGVSIKELRRRMGGAFEGKPRVLRDPSDQRPVLKSWRITIADVYLPALPAGAAGRVRAWAAATREQLR